MNSQVKHLPSFTDKESSWIEFISLRKQIGILDKTLAVELGISTRALTERVTGRAEIKRETILAMKWILEQKK